MIGVQEAANIRRSANTRERNLTGQIIYESRYYVHTNITKKFGQEHLEKEKRNKKEGEKFTGNRLAIGGRMCYNQNGFREGFPFKKGRENRV